MGPAFAETLEKDWGGICPLQQSPRGVPGTALVDHVTSWHSSGRAQRFTSFPLSLFTKPGFFDNWDLVDSWDW